MDGVEFFAAGLHALAPNLSPVRDGICPIHNRPATLYSTGTKLVCRGCLLLRQAYPLSGSKGSKTRLGLGSYMLITKQATTYWGKHIMPPEITVKAASGMLKPLIRSLIQTPPAPPWMFIAFARSNAPDRLHVTTTNDLLWFSGKFYLPGTIDEPMVDCLNRTRVIALHAAADLTREEWQKVVRATAALHTSTNSLIYLQAIYARFPELIKIPLPAERTPEYNAVRLLARES